ncbi:MAG: hypothetical protein N3E41_01705 [Thermofilaceae archaeon]|nr:hypothetical protein [Thermofilaceae archaeon]
MDTKTRMRISFTALLILSLVAFAGAAITILNITEWTVRAKYPPIVKVKGVDAVNTSYIYTRVYSGVATDGTNRTYITITGFRGDPTKYDEILKICNLDNVSYDVSLVYNGTVTGGWTYVKWVKFWIANQGPLTITGTGSSGSAVTTIPAGQCASVAVEVLVSGNLPDNMLGQDILTIAINVKSVKP